jgi:hypothetical protein
MANARRMSQASLREYIPRVRRRFQRRTAKQARSRLLDEFCAVGGFECKYASGVWSGVRGAGRRSGRGVASRRYGEAELKALKHCWRYMEQPCGKRLAGCCRSGWGRWKTFTLPRCRGKAMMFFLPAPADVPALHCTRDASEHWAERGPGELQAGATGRNCPPTTISAPGRR